MKNLGRMAEYDVHAKKDGQWHHVGIFQGASAEAVRRAIKADRSYYLHIGGGALMVEKRNPGCRKNPTKAERTVARQKASAKRRVAVALAKYLRQTNPGTKLAGAKVEKLKGGVLKITPIKVNVGRSNPGKRARQDRAASNRRSRLLGVGKYKGSKSSARYHYKHAAAGRRKGDR